MAPFRIAILWRGDREARRTASAQNNRYHRSFEELSGLGIHAEPAVYDEEFADEVCEQLLKVDGVRVAVRDVFRVWRAHHRSAVSAAPAGGHDPLL